MKHEEFNPVLFEEAYGDLLERFNEYGEGCPKRRSAASDAQKKANQAGEAPKKQAPRKKPEVAKKPDAKPKRKKSCRTPLPTYSETMDFAKGKPCGASHISSKYECRLEEGERKEIQNTLIKAGASAEKVKKLNDGQLSRVLEGIKKYGLKGEQAERASSMVDTLEGTKSGGRKKGGDNLQDPKAAAKYADFYERKGDETFKPKGNTSDKEIDFVIDSLRADGKWSVVSGSLAGKGKPEANMEKEAWGKSGGSPERTRAVLKSLMDSDFKDVNGDTLPWNSGMQLEHKLAGSMGGKDSPDNWLWISTATNQTKANFEKEVKIKGMKGQEAEDFVRAGLIVKLRENAKMSADEVAKIKGAGTAGDLAKKERRQALKENLPLMTREQKLKELEGIKRAGLVDLMRASTRTRGSAWVKSDTRGQQKDPGVEAMAALYKIRWGLGTNSTDLREIGLAIKSSTSDKRSRSEILDSVMEKFGGSSGLTAAERIAILKAAE